MLYLIGQILFLLLLTAIMSGAMGWLLRSFGYETQSRQLESDWTTKLVTLRRARDDYRDQLEQLQANGANLLVDNATDALSDEQKAQVAAHVQRLEEEIEAGHQRLGDLTGKLDGIVAASARRENEYNALRERLGTALEAVQERDQKLERFTAKATQAARQQTQNTQSAQRELEDRIKQSGQTVEILKKRIAELEAGPQVEQEQAEHGKLLNVIQAQKKTIASLNQRLRTSVEASAVAAASDNDSALAGILEERNAAIRGLKERVSDYQEKQEQARELATQNSTLGDTLRSQKQSIENLQQQLGSATRGNEEARAGLQQRLQMRDETIANLQQQLRASTLDNDRAADEDRYARTMEVIRAQEETIARLNERLRQPAIGPGPVRSRTMARSTGPASADSLSGDLFDDKPAIVLDAPDGAPDNLQAIYGVGPILESKLNEIGVYHFRQIAAFGDEDITWISTQMPSFPNRIIRDQWIDQAVELEEERRAQKDQDATASGE